MTEFIKSGGDGEERKKTDSRQLCSLNFMCLTRTVSPLQYNCVIL